MKRLLTLFMVLILTLSLASCKKAPAEPPLPETVDKAQKMQAHLDLYYALLGGFSTNLAEYMATFGWDETINIPEDFDGFSMRLNNTGDLLTIALDFAKKEPHFTNADPALIGLSAPLIPYLEKMAEIKTYYDNKEYESDDFKKGKELHTYLTTKYQNLEPFIRSYQATVSDIMAAQLAENLPAYQKNGLNVHYACLQIFIKAYAIESDLHSQGVFKASQILNADTSRFNDLYAQFQTAVNNYKTLTNGKKEAGSVENIASLADFNKALKELEKSIDALHARLKNKKDFSKKQLAKPHVDLLGSPENIARANNEILTAFYAFRVF